MSLQLPTRASPAAASIRYPGGKNAAGTWQWIISLMPTHFRYCEPFAGSGGVLRRKPPAFETVVVDLDPDVCRWWRRVAWPGVEVVNGCGISWVDENRGRLGPDWLLYVDPPYLISTRSKKRIYRHEMTPDEHFRLLELLDTVEARVMLSGYASAQYESQLIGWTRFEHQAITRGGVLRTEVLWCNFDPCLVAPAHPAMMATAGRNFRERERIKRKRLRWRQNFERLPNYERRAILSELLLCEQRATGDGGTGSSSLVRRQRRGTRNAAALARKEEA